MARNGDPEYQSALPAEGDMIEKTEKKLLNPSQSKLRDLFIAFVFIFVPMAGISIVLLGIVFYGDFRVRFHGARIGTLDLPASTLPPTNSYYTTIGVGRFLVVGSWSSTLAQAIVAPFMLLFSFFVAKESWRKRQRYSTRPSSELQTILKGRWRGILLWIKTALGRNGGTSNTPVHATHLAGIGLLGAILLTALIIFGDMWLHFTTKSITRRFYEAVDSPEQLLNAADQMSASYALKSACSNASAPLPCSIQNTSGEINVIQPEMTYLVLDTGINKRNGTFQEINYKALERDIGRLDGTRSQVITYPDQVSGKNYSLLFNLLAAQERDPPELDSDSTGQKHNQGIDFVARSISMSTQCSFSTRSCFSSNASKPQDDAIPFDCSPQFRGDLLQTSNDTIESVRRWNASFPQTGLNPFNFSAAVALNTVSKDEFLARNQNDTSNGNIIILDSGRLVFAVDCTATVYDVTYSLINGSIASFNPTPSDPMLATIIQAPLQHEFGANYLYQQALIAQISTDFLPDRLAQAFSEAGIAGSSLAFDNAPNLAQRARYDWTVTRVLKAPFLLLVTVCMLYAALGAVFMGVGLYVRRQKEVTEYQAKILPPMSATQFGLGDALVEAVKAEDGDVGNILEIVKGIKDELKNEETGKDGNRENRE